MLKEKYKKDQPKILYPAKLPFKTEEEILKQVKMQENFCQ